jgi:hypothetical protein
MTDLHPLRISDVMRRAGIKPVFPDSAYLSTCAACGTEQSLGEATLEPATEPENITSYRCKNGCAVLAVTGHPDPARGPDSRRYNVTDFSVEPIAPGGIYIRLANGNVMWLGAPREWIRDQ